MTSSEEQIHLLAKDIELREQKARRRAWLLSAIPVLLAVILLGYTVWQIQISSQKLEGVQIKLNETNQQLMDTNISLQDTEIKLINTQQDLDQAIRDLETTQDKLMSTTDELNSTKNELEKTKEELDNILEDLRDANVFFDSYYDPFALDPVSLKEPQIPLGQKQEEVLLSILNLQRNGVGWNRYGFSEEEGFNSPSFAIFILQKYDLISSEYPGDAKPWNILNEVSYLSPGDIVYYEGGYTMFYFTVRGHSFVIGMTPLGIITLEPDFAPVLGNLRVPY